MVFVTVTFIHSADLHLGRTFTSLRTLPQPIYEQVIESSFRALENLVNQAIQSKVDFVLFVGDVFDSESVSLRTYLRFHQQMEKLNEHGIHVFLSHGNHDPIREDHQTVQWPDNVTVFTDETVTSETYTNLSGQVVNIYGFSYTKKAISRNKSREYIKTGYADYHIAMLHGHAEGQSGHDPYAPFSVQELVNQPFDYWALGHIHKRQTLAMNPPVVYPGNIQGMHQQEQGEKGCVLVTLSKKALPVITFVPTANIVWFEEEIDITHIETLDVLLQVINERKERYRKQSTFLLLRFVGSGSLHEILQSANERDDLLWAVNEGEDEQYPFVWIVDMNVHTIGDWDREQLEQRGDFIGELLTTINECEDVDEAVSNLFKNRYLRSYIHAFSESEKQQLLERAERLLLTHLMKEYD